MASSAIFTGLSRGTYKNIIWDTCPSDIYITVRNRCFDDSIKVTQVTSEVDASSSTEKIKVVATPVYRGEEHSFYIENASYGLVVSTDLDYTASNNPMIPSNCEGITIIISESDSTISGKTVYIADLVQATSYDNEITVNDKSAIHIKALNDTGIETKYLQNTDFPEKTSKTGSIILLPSTYTAYAIAGRGYVVRDLNGVETISSDTKTTELYEQVSRIQYQIGNTESNQEADNIELVTAEVPYVTSFQTDFFKAYNDAKNDATKNDYTFNFEFDSNSGAIGNPMIICEPSQYNGSQLKYNNFINNTGLNVLGSTANNESDLVDDIFTNEPDGFSEGDGYELTDSRMWQITSNSKAQFQQFAYDYSKINGVAFTLQTKSQNYPYSVIFTAPIYTAVTFESDSQVVVRMKDRTTVFENVDHLNKVNRYVISYGEANNLLWVNGQQIGFSTQSSVAISDEVLNTIGIDVKDNYSSEYKNINLTTGVLGDIDSVSSEITTPYTSDETGVQIINQKRIDFENNNPTESLNPVLVPKMETEANLWFGMHPFGGIKSERSAVIINDFFSMETVGFELDSGDGKTTYSKSLDMYIEGDAYNTFSISCISSDASFLPSISKASGSYLDTEVVTLEQGNTEEIKLYETETKAESIVGYKITWRASLDEIRFQTLPISNRTMSITFTSPLDETKTWVLNITFLSELPSEETDPEESEDSETQEDDIN